MEKLLTRNEFRESVFKRDNHKCVVCGAKGDDAHHIIERKLFKSENEKSGFFLNNGVTVCEPCHIKAEMTHISCNELREKANIDTVILPEHYYPTDEYDKWGNIILSNGNRVKGEMFSDEAVQKILKRGNILDLFTDRVKYPRTFHLPNSERKGSDDKTLFDYSIFENKNVVITIKKDGENSSFYSDYFHARSIDGNTHPSRNKVKDIWAQIKWEIPEGWRICGENLYAQHTITYDDLESYFYVFSIWDENNYCLSWEETKEYAEMLGLITVPVLYEGIFDLDKYLELCNSDLVQNQHEGVVIRLADEFHYKDFRYSIGKYVKKTFQIQDGHWLNKKIIPNGLK